MYENYYELMKEKGVPTRTINKIKSLRLHQKPAGITLRMNDINLKADDNRVMILFCRAFFNPNTIAHEAVHAISYFLKDENLKGLDLSDDEEIVARQIGFLVNDIFHNCGKFIKYK